MYDAAKSHELQAANFEVILCGITARGSSSTINLILDVVKASSLFRCLMLILVTQW